jgi:CRP-like cAMP-binding protein/predicted GNAT family N-acyltransferase
MSEITIRMACNDTDRAHVYRLRYELYVEQQGLFGDTADHERRWLRDHLDEHATIWLAEHDGEVVGTARLCWGGEGRLDQEIRETFDVDAFTDIVEEQHIAVASRLLLRPAHRQSTLSMQLSVHMVEAMIARGTELMLGECEPHLVNTWARLGMRPFGLNEHPTNGTLVRLALVCGDLDHARSVGSPLVPILQRRDRTGYAPRRLAARLTRSQRIVSEARDRDRFWAKLEETMPLERFAEQLGGLSVEELEAVLDGSHALDCAPGAALIRKGHTSRTLYALLIGTLEVRDGGQRIAVIDRPGELIGEVAFFTASDRMNDVIVGSGGAQVLALSQRSLDHLISQQGSGAAKFLLMVTRSLCQKLHGRSQAAPGHTQRPGSKATARHHRPGHPPGSSAAVVLELTPAA